MATYVAKFRGYIADVPKVIFDRCDGKRFAFDELTAATVTPNIETTPINAGWSMYPVAVLPGQSSFEMTLTSGQFDAELFSMANKVDYVHRGGTGEETYALATSERYNVGADNVITLDHVAVPGTIYISGLEETSEQTVAEGTYKVGTTQGDNAKTTITFAAADSLKFVEVVYDYEQEAMEAIIDNKSSAIGQAACIWPVYGSGDDCTESDIIGYYVVKVFRARITTAPGFDTSYKSAATFQLTLTALDAKRNDGGCYSTAYIEKAKQNG